MKRENSGNKPSRPRTSSSAPRKSSSPRSSSSATPRKRTTSSGSSFSKSKFGEGGSFEKKARPSSGGKTGFGGKPYAKRGDDKSFDRKPRASSSFSKDEGSRPYAKRTGEGSYDKKPRTGGSYSNDGTRPYSKRSDDAGFDRKPRSTGGFRKDEGTRKPYAKKSFDGPSGERKSRVGTGFRKEEGDRKPYARKAEGGFEDRGRKGLGIKRGDKSVFPERTKKAYGSADTFKDRKDMKSVKEVNFDESKSTPKRYDKRSDFSSSTAGKGKFTKKSELKGFKPRASAGDSEEDFRFKTPGSRGKRIDLGVKDEFVSKTKSQSKERITEEALSVGESVRLNRFISNAGVCSRREADELIGAGLVSINGAVVTELGCKVNAGDVVRFNGEKLTVEAKVYIVLNKPKDAITTSDDPDGRNTVMDIFDGKMRERIFPIGRLDRNTTGVLLLTNDGELANRLMHPKYEIKKVYKATLNKNLKPTDLWALSNGVELEDGFIKPDAIATSDAKNKNVVGIEIHSGKNRIIHRMFEHLGYSVEKLDRVLYAGMEKGILKRGAWRELNEKELKALKKSVQLK